ncbi:MAG: FimB/Mfa2 family fimbrial subunit [Sphingobacteriaceae bacterium]
MKKLLFILTCTLFLFSCKKTENSPPEEVLTPVFFSVANFSQKTGEISKSNSSISEQGDTLRNYVKHFYYRVYNAEGKLIKVKNQTSSQTTFGTVSDTLSPGDYTFVFAASVKALQFSGTSLDDASFFLGDTAVWDDTFSKKIAITVGSTPVNESVRLNRVVAGLELNLLQELPSHILALQIIAENECNTYQIISGLSHTIIPKIKTFVFPPGQPIPKSFFMHILNTSTRQKIRIRVYGHAEGSEPPSLFEQRVENIMFYTNRKTVLSGSLTGNEEITVTLNPLWDTTPAEVIPL